MTTADNNTTATSLHGPNLILDVENFGPIAEAKNIEFKPMTVFVGTSNTGKTYLAMLLHAILQARLLRDNPINAFARRQVETGADDNIAQTALLELSGLIAENVAVPFDRKSTLELQFARLTSETRRYLRRELDLRARTLYSHTESNLREYFEVAHWIDIANSATRGFPTIHMEIDDQGTKLKLDMSSHKPRLDLTETKLNFDIDLIWLVEHYRQGLEAKRGSNSIDEIFAMVQLIEVLFPSLPDSYYLPAGRTGILTAHRLLTSSIMANASRMGIDFREPISYHRLPAEFLRYLIETRDGPVSKTIKRGSLRKFNRQDIDKITSCASVLESSLISGQIEVTTESVGVPDFSYVRNDLNVPIFRASSMVTEIAPIIVFLRNHVLPGDLLIIDEPEAHLHPEAQQQMAAALAFMVRSGLRVLITTHSHYMVEQLSAFVNASKLDEATRKRALSLGGALGEEDIYLNEDETAVYSFKMSQEHGGSVVEEIFMGEEFEYGPEDHSTATVKQFNRLQRVLEAREAVEFGDLD